MDNQIRAIVERMWKDIASLPWQDLGWTANEAAKQQTRQHFITSTVEDLLTIINQPEVKVGDVIYMGNRTKRGTDYVTPYEVTGVENSKGYKDAEERKNTRRKKSLGRKDESSQRS